MDSSDEEPLMGRRRRCVVGSDAGSPESKRQKLSDDEPLLDTLVSVPLEPAAAASEAPLLPRTPASSCTDVPAPAITLNGGAVPKVEMDVKDVKEESAEFKSETSTPRPEHSRNLMKVMAMPNPPPPIPSGPPAYKTAWGRSAEVPVMEDSPSPSPSHRRKKRHVVTEEHIEPINQWWANESSKDDGRQWSYLEHKGIVFGKPYEPHERPLKVMGVDVILPPEAEEAASFWCNAVESEYGTKEKFIRNFWADFLASLPVDHPIVTGVGFEHTVQFEDCDFSEMLNFFKARKEEETFRKKKLTSDEKRAEAAARQLVDGPNATCLYDGLREKVGAFKAEPPSLFRGRGAHPKMGKLKKRIFPEEVTLNLADDAPVPMLCETMSGHCWKDVYHDNTVTWLSFYRDSINNSFKYVFLSPASAVKGQTDHAKYEKARKLQHFIKGIRRDYTSKMLNGDAVDRQLGLAVYVIDVLALRVGNEKDTDAEADTVGCCSLRKEHITTEDNNKVTLDFLGKDSIRYFNTVTIGDLAFKTLTGLLTNKKPETDVFDRISPTVVNRYLKELMPGLSAKVFRTYNASFTLQQELWRINPRSVDTANPEDLRRFYEDSNRQVAVLCNHQRAVSRQHDSSMEKMQKQLEDMLEDIREVAEATAWVKAGKKTKFTFKSTMKDRVSVAKESWTLDQAKRKQKQLQLKRENHELKMKLKDANKAVATGTSRQHYCDPRISVAFCKKFEEPIEKVFNGSLRKKFPWAMYATSEFVW